MSEYLFIALRNSQAFHQLPIPRDCIRVKELREII